MSFHSTTTSSTPESNKWLSHLDTPKIDDINEETRRGVMDGSIPSAVVDTGATSNVGKYGCSLELTSEPSHKIFTTASQVCLSVVRISASSFLCNKCLQ